MRSGLSGPFRRQKGHNSPSAATEMCRHHGCGIWLSPDCCRESTFLRFLTPRFPDRPPRGETHDRNDPATVVVGTDGLIKARFVDPDYRRRMDIDGMLAALRSA